MFRKENALIIIILGAILLWALFMNKPRHVDSVGENRALSLTQTAPSR
jgi:hypothetical protein